TLVIIDNYAFFVRPEENVLFPITRRSSIAISGLLPIGLTYAFETVRRGGIRNLLMVGLVSLLILLTHAVEQVHLLLVLVSGPVLGITGVLFRRIYVSGVSPRVLLGRTIQVLGISLLVTVIYRLIHVVAAPDAEGFENQ